MPFQQLKDLTGQRFARLTVIERAANAPYGNAQWLCRCECGATAVVVGTLLRTGNTKSCGCLRRETASAQSAVNADMALGHAAERGRTYKTWEGIIQRTTNPNNHAWDYYGGRGITVCDRWRTYVNFLADMGEKPEGLSIDRIDPDGNYEPGNCRWATHLEQMRNTRRYRAAHPT